METLLNEIDALLLATFKDKGLKAYGLCELVTKDDKPNPVTVSLDAKKKSRTVAEIHDRFNGIFYHRELNGNWREDEEFSFGDSLSKRHQKRIRTVLAYKTKLGEGFITDFVTAFPDKITITDYKFVFLTQGTLIADHEAVFTQEYGNASYEKHRIDWNVYALEYDIEFIKC